MKKKSKPTKKQVRHEQAKRRRSESQRRRRQETRKVEEQLWREMQPLLEGYDLDDKEEWFVFATRAMLDSARLCDEPEFEGLAVNPADALQASVTMHTLYVPAPEELARMSDEERKDVTSEADINTVAKLVNPALQRDVLNRFGQCRRRLKRAGQTDTLSLAAAVELLLRMDTRAEIWGTCGILHVALQRALSKASALEKEEAGALRLAQAFQPDVETVFDLEAETPAYTAFWEAVGTNTELADYVRRQMELTDDSWDIQQKLDGELALAIFDPEEIEGFSSDVAAAMRGGHIEEDQSESRVQNDALDSIEQRLPELIRTRFSPERFSELLQDLENVIEDQDSLPTIALRARLLHGQFSNAAVPYWENGAFGQFLLGVLLSPVWMEEGEEAFDDDGDDDDEA